MILYIIIIMISTLLGWILTLADNDSSNFPYSLVGGIIGVILPGIILLYVINRQPKAIDVYKGRTTLEITYKDGIPIDSVVVFKDKEK